MVEIKLGKYRHFKGMTCEVIGIGKNSETLEKFVIYKDLEKSEKFRENTLWIRSLSMFTEEIEKDGKKIPRFKFIE